MPETTAAKWTVPETTYVRLQLWSIPGGQSYGDGERTGGCWGVTRGARGFRAHRSGGHGALFCQIHKCSPPRGTSH